MVADRRAARRAGERRRVDVGVGSIPIALLADRWGRVKSITAMAGLWGLATIGCGLAQNYGQMMATRAAVGLGEAGYGSAGSAILFHVFPKRQHAMVGGAFLAAALFGSVGGVIVGGVVSAHFGWRHAFIGVGAAGLLSSVAVWLLDGGRDDFRTRTPGQGA